jgi:hypothetical protein
MGPISDSPEYPLYFAFTILTGFAEFVLICCLIENLNLGEVMSHLDDYVINSPRRRSNRPVPHSFIR